MSAPCDRLTAFVEVRGQHSLGNCQGHFGGPDTYVAVQVVPAGVQPLKYLNHRVARVRGIQIIWCGEGYDAHRGPRSMLGQALSKAEATAARINATSAEIEQAQMEAEEVLCEICARHAQEDGYEAEAWRKY